MNVSKFFWNFTRILILTTKNSQRNLRNVEYLRCCVDYILRAIPQEQNKLYWRKYGLTDDNRNFFQTNIKIWMFSYFFITRSTKRGITWVHEFTNYECIIVVESRRICHINLCDKSGFWVTNLMTGLKKIFLTGGAYWLTKNAKCCNFWTDRDFFNFFCVAMTLI